MTQSIAIIGAGLSGLSLAGLLPDTCQVTLFEKSVGVGGRMATRRLGEHHFDHGAQFFTARSRAFRQFLKPLMANGLVQEWLPTIVTLDPDNKDYRRPWFEPHYVAVPQMNSVAKALAEGQDVRSKTEVSGLRRSRDGWYLTMAEGMEEGPWDWVVVTAPAPQSQLLLSDWPQALSYMEGVEFSPCLAFLVSLTDGPLPAWQVAQPKASFLRWLALNSHKPGRPEANAWLVHADNAWSAEVFDEENETLVSLVGTELSRVTGLSAERFADIQVKRWRYARAETSATSPFFLDSSAHLALCGDWCVGGNVEAAFTSARQLAKSLSCLL